MQFLDEAKIFIRSGTGGAGCLSFRREANVPRGGPDGGDGGRGGSVIARCVSGLNTLIDYRYQQHFKAKTGDHGRGRNMNGKAAEDIILKVPSGTQIFAEDGETLICDLINIGDEFVLASGGSGGLGNVNFKSSTNRAPRHVTPGELGEEMWIWLKLKLISDVGLVGLPNAGKSTFLSRTSRAKPKIADYPFTTLKPQLGVAYIDGKEFVIADLPGLIEGAHEGVGLGIKFLRHVERCSVILHLIDVTSEDIVDSYKVIRNELSSYSELLAKKPEIVALNKCDAISDDDLKAKLKSLKKVTKAKPFTISAISGSNIDITLRELLKLIEENKQEDINNDSDPEPNGLNVQ